ncbi:26124_t:CDS:10 [Gigaspora margarita]|uniref:26124_t:CDS:1 n=1 Tax=Gigaspora margarita TaxID=4874 RepID=A0ABM8W5Q9_GIGMA|nr:26124_t:CDS:10 [Gigaspora margarita]
MSTTPTIVGISLRSVEVVVELSVSYQRISLCSVEVVVELSVFDDKTNREDVCNFWIQEKHATIQEKHAIIKENHELKMAALENEKSLLIERVALQHKGITETLHNRGPNAHYQDDDDFQPVVSNSVNRQKRKNLSISMKDKQSNALVKKTKTAIRNKENIDNNTSSVSKSTLSTQFDKSERDELTSNIFKEDDKTSSSRKLAEMGNKDETVKMNKTGPFLQSELNRKEIENAYKLMKRENMWKLKSGRLVEEELYKLGLDMRFEHASHSFIVDVDDEAVKHHFDKEECLEIYNASGPEVPQLLQEIIEYLAKFTNKAIKSLKEVRKAINEPDERFDDKYDKDAYHDLDYIRFALVREIDNDTFKDQKLEVWFNCHVWNAIVDQSFSGLNGISVVRGESSSLANADRKNAQRIMPERRQMDHRGDFIIRKVGDGENDEYGIGEAGKLWIDNHESKFLKESSIKTPKVLKDMLLKLRNKVDDNSIKLQTVGMIHSGLMTTILRLDNPFGYVCRIRRSESMQVPDDEKNFPDVLILLAAVLNFKAIVKKTAKTVQNKSILVAETFLNAGMQSRSRNSDTIPKCIKSPKNLKSKEIRLPKRPSKLRLQIDDSDED